MRWLIILLLLSPFAVPNAQAMIIWMEPDGSGDYPTLQDAIDAAVDDDVIILRNGVYEGDGNRDLQITMKSITLESEDLDPDLCSLSLEGTQIFPHRAMTILNNMGMPVTVRGLRFTGGWQSDGGALFCVGGETILEDCVFETNEANEDGGAVYGSYASLQLSGCRFVGNVARDFGGAMMFFGGGSGEILDTRFEGNSAYYGGAISCNNAAPGFESCRFQGNDATSGVDLYCEADSDPELRHCCFHDGGGVLQEGLFFLTGHSDPVFRHCTIATETAAVICMFICSDSSPTIEYTVLSSTSPSEPTFYCAGDSDPLIQHSILYDIAINAPIADDFCSNGNLYLDPKHCDPGNGEYTVRSDSPCLPANSPSGELIGAFGQGCVDEVSSYTIYADGSGDFATIQEAVDASVTGDTILLGDGTFTNTSIRVDHGLLIESISGRREDCIIEPPAGSPALSVVNYTDCDPMQLFLYRMTFRNAVRAGYGGGISIQDASPYIYDCVVQDCEATYGGGMAVMGKSAPSIRECDFRRNYASEAGGGLAADIEFWAPGVDPFTLEDCSFLGDSSVVAGALALIAAPGQTVSGCTFAGCGSDFGESVIRVGGHPNQPIIFDNCIVAFSERGASIYADPGDSLLLMCCDIFGNAGGDWVEGIAQQLQYSGNLHKDPLFCDLAGGDLSLSAYSPCMPDSNPGCGLIGAEDVGCGWPDRIVVAGDGSGDYLTIAEGLAAASTFDTVLVKCGEYLEHDLVVPEGIVLLGESTEAGCVVVDAQGQGRVFEFSGSSNQTLLRGFTLQNGYSATSGGAILCGDADLRVEFCYVTDSRAGVSGGGLYAASSDLILKYTIFLDNMAHAGGAVHYNDCDAVHQFCRFGDNEAEDYGGGIRLSGAVASFARCIFHGNHSDGTGGAIYAVDESRAEVGRSTFYNNSAPTGSALRLSLNSTARVDTSIVSFAPEGVPVHCVSGSEATAACTDIFGNLDGDWVACLEGLEGIDGNFSQNPRFCDATNLEFHLYFESPCLPDGNDCMVQVGALGEGCDDITQAEGSVPEFSYLAQNHPNPFNPVTRIAFGLSEPAKVRLAVFDIAGRRVATLLDSQMLPAGRHEFVWKGRDSNGTRLSSGVYFYRLETGDYSATRKLTLLK